jgi:hypothetical protein
LRTAEEDARLILRGLSERQHQIAEHKLSRESHLSRLQAASVGSGGGGGRATSSISTFMSPGRMNPAGAIEHVQPQTATRDQLAEVEAEIAAATADLVAINERMAGHQASVGKLVPALTRWIASIPADVRIEPHRPSEAAKKAAKGSATVEAARERISELKADIHTIRSAPPPSAEVKRRARASRGIGGTRAAGLSRRG